MAYAALGGRDRIGDRNYEMGGDMAGNYGGGRREN